MFTLLFTASKLTFTPIASWPLVAGMAVLLALLSVYIYTRPRGDFSPGKRRLLITLRVLAFTCVVLALLQPSINIKSRESRRLNVMVLVDGSASMDLPYLPGAEGDSARSRASLAAEFSRALAEKLPRRFGRQLFVFSDTLTEADPEGLAPAARAGSPRSALGLALTEACRRIGNAPAAVVLVSDGAASYGPDPSGVARTLSFPVYTVAAAEEGRFRDAEVSEVLSPSTGFTGSEVPVLVRVKGHGLENLELPVTISEAGLPVSAGRIRLAGSAHSELLLSVRPATAGVHFYECACLRSRGKSPLNNAKHFAVEAVSEKLKVVYLEGDLTWDFRFLKRALESDPRLETAFSLVKGWNAGSPNVRNVSTGVPPGLAGAAVVIVGDGAAGHLAPGVWRTISEFVSSGGGILFAGVDGLAQAPAEARELLPVALRPAQSWGSQRLMDVALTDQGAQHPVCQVENDAALIRESWKDVSPLMGAAAVDRVKPGASVLLEGRSEDETWPLLVAGSFGRGRVLLAGAGGFWRWGFTLPGVGGSKRLFPGLVSNAVSWLSETGAQRRFAVVPARWVFESGDDVRFLVRGIDDTSAVRVEVTDAGGTQTQVSGAARGGTEGDVTQGEDRAPSFGALEPGAYSYKASGSQAGKALSFRGSFMVDTAGAEDRSLPRPAPPLVRRAGVRGKAFRAGHARTGRMDEAQLERLVREISAFGDKVVVERQVRLWNHPVLLALFTCLLALEWWFRRRSGLP
jgi:hypothetical protein